MSFIERFPFTSALLFGGDARNMTYTAAELVDEAAASIAVGSKPKLLTRAAFRLAGRPDLAAAQGEK